MRKKKLTTAEWFRYAKSLELNGVELLDDWMSNEWGGSGMDHVGPSVEFVRNTRATG